MNAKNRRNFLKAFGFGAAGAIALPAFGATKFEEITAYWDDLGLGVQDDTSEAYWDLVKSQFIFAEGLYYFNNASLGPSSIAIQNATKNYRDTLDGFPSRYMWGGWKDEKETVRKALAAMFAVDAEEIALIHNTTEGMNLIARSFDLKPGDEVLLADHEHPSGTIPWEAWQESKGVTLVRPKLPILPKSIEEIVTVYEKAITSKTKVISMCHIVNTNGMILPVKEVSEMAHKRGIFVAVDGAQSAGMFGINLADLGCDFYAASSHKWLFSPKGVGVFYAKKKSQSYLKPLMVARGHKDTSIRRLENYNTRNLPEVLGLGASVAFHHKIGAVRIHNRIFVLKNYFRKKIEGNPKFKLKTPKDDSLSAAIQVVEILGKEVRDVKQELWDTYGIDCRPMTGFGLNALRFSFAIYITKEDIDYLVNALEELA